MALMLWDVFNILNTLSPKTIKLKAEARLDLLRQVGVAVDTWLKSAMNQVCFVCESLRRCIPMSVCMDVCAPVWNMHTNPLHPLSVHAVGNGGAGEWALGQLHIPWSLTAGETVLTVWEVLLSCQASGSYSCFHKNRTFIKGFENFEESHMH